ncbi:hypothetical protein AAFC00_001302 [Neodothiora populina]|uniref:Uncharacterized protein n=1 Tax=Neodothiora populina TaxID=2781224 RepID=A0ABR3PNL7_9PEZI
MSSKLIPANPDKVMVIRNVTPEIVTLSVPFLRFGRIKFGGRATLVRLQNGTVACFSPVALTPEVHKTISAMGTVKYICANDAEHHIFMDDWHKAFPEARLIGPEELKAKREKQGKPLPWTNLFKTNDAASLEIDDAFDNEFDAEYVHAHQNKELVFNHRPSRTLIEADLLFNLPAHEQMSKTDESPTTGFLTKMFNAIGSTQGSATWQKRFLWYGVSSGDRAAFNKSIARIDAWDFDRLIPCHGEVIEQGGKGIFRKVFEWHLAAAKKET